MKNREIISCREKLNYLQTSEIDQLLQAELRKESPNEEVVLSILDLLRDREFSTPERLDDSTLKAWSIYQDRLSAAADKNIKLEVKRRRQSWLKRKTVVIAATVCLVVMAIPVVFGSDTIRSAIAQWTDEFFSFSDSEENMRGENYEFKTENPGLQQVYSDLVELGVSKPVVPTWLPEGFVLADSKTLPTPVGNKLSFYFLNGEKSISLFYTIPMQDFSRYEKAEGDAEIYESEGVKHYIAFNDHTWTALWMSDNVECVLISNLNKEELTQIIDSIYKE